MEQSGDTQHRNGGMAALTATVLDEEAARHAAQAEKDRVILFPDELLPGVGGEKISLKDGIEKGGRYTFGTLMTLNLLDEFHAGALGVLAPDIQDAMNLSDGEIGLIQFGMVSGLMLGIAPWGYLADRVRRGPLIGIATLIFTGFTVLTGLAANAFMLFFMLFFGAFGKANTQSAHPSLIADAYPLGVRGRILSTKSLASQAVRGVAPALVGLVAAGASWRMPYLIMALPVGFAAFLAFKLPEPVRGQWEKDDVLGQIVAEENPAPISAEAASERLWKIRTFRGLVIAFAAMGFGLFVMPAYRGLFLEEEFGLDVVQRGYVLSALHLPLVLVVPFVGRIFDDQYRRDPAKAMAMIGFIILPVSVLLPIQFSMGSVLGFVVLGAIVQALMAVAFSMVGPIVQAVVPFRLRGQGSAVAGLFIFLIGGVLGNMAAAVVVGELGERMTIIVFMAPAIFVGALHLINTSRHIRQDLSLVVSELQEEMAENERQADDPDNIPVLQVNEIDFAYGQVQVLFDLSFEVKRGEVLALLGTNGAGKSTILRVISGLATPERGVVRLNGQTITFTSPEQRTGMGIHMLAGGKGIFDSMSVRQNLVMGAYHYRSDQADVDRRIEKVLRIFPDLERRRDQEAGSMSGGQQQMLALARTLLHDPEILIIDELSLGLAPLVVQNLLGIIEELKAEGLTMIIVEQSLNVALAIADRAVFLEKGRVRFVGGAQELKERDDLARAVFLGAEGG